MLGRRSSNLQARYTGFKFEYRSTRLAGQCFFELCLLGAAAGNYEFYGTLSLGGFAGSFEFYGALLLGAAAVLLALFYYQGQGDRDLKLQRAMVLLRSRHAGQSQGAAKLRREDLRIVTLPLRWTLPFWIQVLRWTFHRTFQKLAWIPRILESGNDSMWIDPVTHL